MLIIDPPGSTEGDHLFTQKWKLTVDPLWGDHQPPRINRGDHLFTQKWKLTVDPLWGDHQSPQDQQRLLSFHVKVQIDCWSSLRWSSIPRINRGDHLLMQKWKWTVDPLWGNCRSPPPEAIRRFWAKVGKHLGMPCFTEDIPFGKVQ